MTPLLWILAAGVLGFLITALFAGILKMDRTTLLIPYVLLAGLFLYGYARWSGFDLGQRLADGWVWGVLGAAVVGAIAVRNVSAQPASPRAEGATLTFHLLWWGLIYGALDGLFLSVMPVMATQQAFNVLAWSGTWYGQVLAGAAALVASLYVAFAYHLGYPEFRNRTMRWPVFGNGLMTVAYLLTGNPLAAVLSHVVMHVASVLRGAEGTIQLPPHYGEAAA